MNNASPNLIRKEFFLTGNPNSGKTSLFNALTGERRHVGNWPGVTVDRVEGVRKVGNLEAVFYDLPGTYSLSPVTPEEKVVVEALGMASNALIINVVDASNLERNLFLTIQLLELGVRPIIVLNCVDEVRKRNDTINPEEIARLTGCPVFQTVARSGEGVEKLFEAALELKPENWKTPAAELELPAEWLKAAERFLAIEDTSWRNSGTLKRFYALRSLVNLREGNSEANLAEIRLELSNSLRKGCSTENPSEAGLLNLPCELASSRYRRVSEIKSRSYVQSEKPPAITTEKIDAVLTHKWVGLPIFAALISFIFWSTFTLGEAPMGWLEGMFETAASLVEGYLSESLFRDMLVEGVIPGVGGVVVFIPNILILFFWLALLEDSGYLARAAFLMDRIMQSIGLHGRAVIPFLMGVGCNVPAIMATRILENRNQRLFSIFLIPLVSCAARLPLLVMLCGTFFPDNPGRWLFLLYALNLVILLVLARLTRTLFNSDSQAAFMLEMPPYRLPMVKSVVRILWDKCWHFLEKAGTVILAGTVMLWLLSAFPREVPLSRDYETEIAGLTQMQEEGADTGDRLEETIREFEHEQMQGRYMARIGRAIHFFVEPLGFGWREAVSLIPGFLAKETVISTLSVLYLPVSNNIGEGMRQEGMTELKAFVFMLFTLLYIPCLATVGVMYRESGSFSFTSFAVLAHVFLAWAIAFIVLNLTSFFLSLSEGYDPLQGVGIIVAVAAAIWYIFRKIKNDVTGCRCEGCPKIADCSGSKLQTIRKN